ncbi:MAG: class I SAM-dependent methyltransferase [Candidatus Eremiobacteraeota bacterium]|nr:class I SAM-dependent methyltransferase [Candidatus Eremiobacteraeota bacterium]
MSSSFKQKMKQALKNIIASPVREELEFVKRENAMLREESESLRQDLVRLQGEFKEKNNELIGLILKSRSFFIERGNERERPSAASLAPQRPVKDFESYAALLEKEAPAAYREWRKLLEVNSKDYEGFPVESCSVEGHGMAGYFQDFIAPYLRGRVLDIGCGPQPLPSYLEGYPLSNIAGIDPIPAATAHPFTFVRCFAEWLPWNEGSFETVINATSLDHVLLLERSLEEVRRVLCPGGHFLVWVGFVEGAAKYDPFDKAIVPVDRYHLFHFSRDWFEELMSRFFEVEESFHLERPSLSSFYSLVPLKEGASHGNL